MKVGISRGSFWFYQVNLIQFFEFPSPLQQGTGPVDVAVSVAGGQGREGADVPPPHYSTSHDLKFSYSEINFQDLSWSFRNLYKSMLEKSSSSQHGESWVPNMV